MDIEAFLKLRTAFIRYFYENGVEPFEEIKTAIENEGEPYVPPYSEDGEPPFLEEWMDAEQGVDTVGHVCISMLSSSLQLFLKTWVNRIEEEHGMKFNVDFKRFPKPFFASETEIKMAIRDDDESVIWWLRPSIKSAREKVLAAVDQVEAFCSWLEKEYWK